MNTIVYPQVVLEYRGTTVSTYAFTDQKTGEARKGYTINHSMEAVSENGDVTSYVVKETPKSEVSAEDYRPSYKRGQQYTVQIRSCEFDKAVMRVSASTIIPVPAGPETTPTVRQTIDLTAVQSLFPLSTIVDSAPGGSGFFRYNTT